jgi:hypothetical protein
VHTGISFSSLGDTILEEATIQERTNRSPGSIHGEVRRAEDWERAKNIGTSNLHEDLANPIFFTTQPAVLSVLLFPLISNTTGSRVTMMWSFWLLLVLCLLVDKNQLLGS